MKKVIDKKLILYCILGFVNYVFCTGLMFLLHDQGICSDHTAPLVNYGVGGVIWYFGNVKLVFKQKQTPALIVRFILEIIICYVISYYILAPLICKPFIKKVMAEKDRERIRMAVGSVTYAIVNYFGQRFYVFRDFNQEKKRHRAEREQALYEREQQLSELEQQSIETEE